MADRLAYRVAEFSEAIGVSRSKGYELIARGEVPAIRIGGSLRIPVEAARQWLEHKMSEGAATTA